MYLKQKQLWEVFLLNTIKKKFKKREEKVYVCVLCVIQENVD